MLIEIFVFVIYNHFHYLNYDFMKHPHLHFPLTLLQLMGFKILHDLIFIWKIKKLLEKFSFQ